MEIISFYVLLALLASLLIGVSKPIQKKGLDKLPNMDDDWWIAEGKIDFVKIRKVLHNLLNKYFIVGIVLFFIGWLAYLTSISIGQITVVQPLLTVGNFWTILLGLFWLHEKLEKSEYIGIIITIAGIFLLNMAA